MWVQREVEAVLLERAATRPVVVLTGARQTGKTSLMRRLFPDHAFVTLDLPSEAEQAERDPASFLRRYPPPVILDEVQYAPRLFRYLKVAVDRDRGRPGAFLLTGSQPLALMRSVSDSLAGRASVNELEPLSFAEARVAHPELTVEEFLVRGGFPELYQNLRIEVREFYRSLVLTYLERDLRQFLRVANLRDHERFLRGRRAALGQPPQPRRSGSGHRHQRFHRRRLALRTRGVAPDRAAGTVVLEPDEGARQTAKAVPPGCRTCGLPVRYPFA